MASEKRIRVGRSSLRMRVKGSRDSAWARSSTSSLSQLSRRGAQPGLPPSLPVLTAGRRWKNAD